MESPLFPTQVFSDDFESVYEPSEDTFVMMDAIQQDLPLIQQIKPLVCVEVGCGSGAVITSLAKATDFNGKALSTTRKCGSVNGVEGCVQLVRTDLTQAIESRLSHSIDLLLFNPPYVPTLAQEV
ncbi:unnamed protein product [Oppiella nova]|uniref:Methyltransferase small domain-containing protein n=1 Tax=Oppiella nova TaxID=334625 RepID=A0A7R9MBM1_9ACAR|nr:unnamed protein product [Oppiella nova]CAG2173304.1 unnamed protein product [Oppiella nova]